MTQYVVVHMRHPEQLACYGSRGVPGTRFIWSKTKPMERWDGTVTLPDWVLSWETERGASQFAAMNGGTVIRVADLILTHMSKSAQQMINELSDVGELQTWN